MKNFFAAEMVRAGLTLGICFVVAAFIGSMTLYNVRALDNTLSVTGSAKQSAEADSAKWTVSVTRTAYEADVPDTQARVTRDTNTVVGFFKAAKNR